MASASQQTANAPTRRGHRAWSRTTRQSRRSKTTELLTMLGIVAAILIAAASADNFDAPRAWTLVAVVGSAYMISRGLAKSGSRHVDLDH